MDPALEVARLVEALAGHVARRSLLGTVRVPRPRPELAPAASPPSRPASGATAHEDSPTDELQPFRPSAAAETTTEGPEVRANQIRAARCPDLAALRAEVADCTACPLAHTRTQTVFCDGPDRARLLFVGEAPGEHEDRRGVPFVGAAGQLLTDIIRKGMGLERRQVHIANVLKCRPPGNRDPEAEETARCTPFLDRQIELVDPEVIIALGLHAARHLLHSPLPMGRLRGKVHAWRGRKVIATYHPAYLLRTPSAKKDCWVDIQLAMRELGLTPPARPEPR